MSDEPVKFSEVQETLWTRSLKTAAVGGVIILLAVLGLYFAHLELSGRALLFINTMLVLGIVGGTALVILAVYQSYQVNKMPRIPFPCPYCGLENLFLSTPTENFVCESCHRTVHFENGEPVPVRTVVCQVCRAEHRVAINVQRYVCDRCNRPLQIDAFAPATDVVTGKSAPTEAAAQNFDVLLVAFDHRRENDVAFAIQNRLTVTLPEARRLIGTVTQKTPLPVGFGVPQLKAEAIRRQLEELGATAVVLPTGASMPTA